MWYMFPFKNFNIFWSIKKKFEFDIKVKKQEEETRGLQSNTGSGHT